MSYIGEYNIGDSLVWTVMTRSFATQALTDADSPPTYRIYKAENAVAILTGTMAKLDDGNTTGYYSEEVEISIENGFEEETCYSIYIQFAVSSVVGGEVREFQVNPAVALATELDTALTEIVGNSRAYSAYSVGNEAVVRVSFTDNDDNLVDPAVVEFEVTHPDGSVDTFTYGVGAEITRSSLGEYYASVILDEVGTWYVRFTGTGPLSATVEHALLVGGISLAYWSDDERGQIRYRLGIDGETDVPTADPNLEVTISAPGEIADAVWNEALAGHLADGTTGRALSDILNATPEGVGSEEVVYSVSEPDSDPIAGADVWITTHISGVGVIAYGTTDASGDVTFYLDPGTYYGWKQKAGYTFTNPNSFVVS